MVDDTGFMVDSVTLEAPKPDENTAKAIQGVVDAQQQLEKLEIEKNRLLLRGTGYRRSKGKSTGKRSLKTITFS